MKPFLPFLLYVMLPLLAHAQSPRMGVRQSDGSVKLLEINEAEITINLLGDAAETTYELNFRNDEARAVEGEFVLPLPPGATVSGYALEVNGKMREGVAVEKERARIAYETIKRMMIDPGLVEREANNTYRTKVYPVPAKGTKRLRISYIEALASANGSMRYALPLEFPRALQSFRCTIESPTDDAIHIDNPAGLDFTKGPVAGLRAEMEAGPPKGVLKLSTNTPNAPRIIVEDRGQPYFFLSDSLPDIPAPQRPRPQSIILIWDASGSRSKADDVKMFDLLEKWFRLLGNTRVKLRVLRNSLEDGGEFEVRNGQWSSLKKVLQLLDYDGATAFSQVRFAEREADMVVCFSDGITTMGTQTPRINIPWAFVCPNSAGFVRPPIDGPGAVIDLSRDSRADAMEMLTTQPLRLIQISGSGLGSYRADPLVPGQRLRVSGVLDQRSPGKLKITYGYGDDAVVTHEVSYDSTANANGAIRRLHAQRVLADLEYADRPDRDRIIRHCMEYGLVSDYTSLIVLERLEDYVQYQIEPPEPELLEAYRNASNQRARAEAAGLGNLAQAWAHRMQWFNTRFPGYEWVILPRLRQVSIWKNAITKQFKPEQCDAAAVAVITGWLEKGTELIRHKPNLKSAEEEQAWRKAIDALNEQGSKLANTPVKAPPAGQPLAFSIRGLVKQPGVITAEAGITLRKAIDKAGGLDPDGTLDSVALYRNAGKVVYNILSNEYRDVALMPGDMIVVEPSQPPFDSAMDPFAEAPSTPPDFSKQPAIRQGPDVLPDVIPFRESFSTADPFAGSGSSRPGWDGPGAFPVTPATPSAFRRRGRGGPPELPWGEPTTLSPSKVEHHANKKPPARNVAEEPSSPPDLNVFIQQLASAKDPAAFYQKSRGKAPLPARFYPQAAQALAAKHPALARRVLSNLLERQPGNPSALRAYAYWLAAIGQQDEAIGVLEATAKEDRLNGWLMLDLSSLHAAKGDAHAAAAALLPALEKVKECPSGNLAALMLTDFNGYYRRPGTPGRSFPRHPLAGESTYQSGMAMDLRIVALSSHDGADFRLMVTEPNDHFVGLTTSDDSRWQPLPSVTPYGGVIFSGGHGSCEYMIRHAVSGNYQIACSSQQPTTVRLAIHTNWGRPNHTCKIVTWWLEPGQAPQKLDHRHEFQPPAR